MNKDKAIQLLERLQDPEPYEPMLTKDAYDAIQMDIDALSADGDTISREAAIEVIDSFNVFESRSDQIKLEQMIGELPSAQLEIIRCRNCKFASGDSRICMKFGHSPIGELDFCAWAERRTDEQTKD